MNLTFVKLNTAFNTSLLSFGCLIIYGSILKSYSITINTNTITNTITINACNVIIDISDIVK